MQYNSSAFLQVARDLIHKGNLTEAKAILDGVIDIDSSDIEALADRGTLNAMLGDLEVASSDLGKAIALGSTDPHTLATLATVMLEQGKLLEARAYFTQSILAEPNQPIAYYNRSRVLSELGQTDAAISDLETCLTFEPDVATTKLIQQRLDALRIK